jgi:hypothetical protein
VQATFAKEKKKKKKSKKKKKVKKVKEQPASFAPMEVIKMFLGEI